MLITLNLGTNLANSWCQLLRVEAGEIIKKGPQMFSLWNLHIKKNHTEINWGEGTQRQFDTALQLLHDSGYIRNYMQQNKTSSQHSRVIQNQTEQI